MSLLLLLKNRDADDAAAEEVVCTYTYDVDEVFTYAPDEAYSYSTTSDYTYDPCAED